MAGTVSLRGGGSYLLGGGVLEVNSVLETAGGTLNCSGGPATIVAGSNALVDLTNMVGDTASMSLYAGANSLVIVPSLSAAAAFHVFDNAGITDVSGSTLMVGSGQGFSVPAATITGPVNCQGMIAATTGGAINLTNGLQLSGKGQVALGSGTLTVNDTASGMSDSSQLAAAYAYIGSSGTGSFAQSGGTDAVSGSLYLGYRTGSSGTYNFSGSGLLTAGALYIGNSGDRQLHAVGRDRCGVRISVPRIQDRQQRNVYPERQRPAFRRCVVHRQLRRRQLHAVGRDQCGVRLSVPRIQDRQQRNV